MPVLRSLTTDDLHEISDLLNLDGDDVRKEYRGRGMYGSSCVGFVVEPGDVVAVGAALVATLVRNVDPDNLDDVLDDAVGLARRACVDSMGVQAIVYFPGITVADSTNAG
jgi:hypothetical protein